MEEVSNDFESEVRNFIKSNLKDEMPLYDYLYGYKLFEEYNNNSDNFYLKSALAKVLVESKIEETEEALEVDIYEIKQELLSFIDSFKSELDRSSTLR